MNVCSKCSANPSSRWWYFTRLLSRCAGSSIGSSWINNNQWVSSSLHNRYTMDNVKCNGNRSNSSENISLRTKLSWFQRKRKGIDLLVHKCRTTFCTNSSMICNWLTTQPTNRQTIGNNKSFSLVLTRSSVQKPSNPSRKLKLNHIMKPQHRLFTWFQFGPLKSGYKGLAAPFRSNFPAPIWL